MAVDNTLGDVIRQFSPALQQKRGVSGDQLKALWALGRCRTPELGGSVIACHDCGSVHYVLHSCRNRHCPRCQGIDKELWIEARKQELLPVKYFHVVFTVPHELLELFRFNRELMYNLLFEKSWETLSLFARDPKLLGAQAGAIAILHTWDQRLNYHPHLHLIVPAGGIDENGHWKSSKQDGDFLFDVKQMSAVFSARFVRKLRRLKRQGKVQKYVPRDLIKKPWVVYAKQAFGSPESVVEYLGRYTHRVAISNARILEVTDSQVTFSWCDRENGYQKKTETLSGVAFLTRFLDHIVPPRFRRIRHLGFLSSRNKKQSLEAIRKSLGDEQPRVAPLSRTQILELRFGERSVLKCKDCGGELLLLETYPGKRAPPVNPLAGMGQ
ncbi:IS91 family transposase [Mangrovibacterium marinum]|uniref:IS91 family transposase n=1 Tax=Mangrovibacterium marinum TaxID=1639118 RepID=UPI002A18B32A|nr:IS91 family transposase [Mangrovibacterium marinum]